MSQQIEEPTGPVPPGPGIVTVQHHSRVLDVFQITDSELNEIVAEHDPWPLTFASAAVGAFAAFLATVITANLSGDKFAVFVALTVTTAVFTIYFGLQSIREIRKSRAVKQMRVAQLKKRPMDAASPT